MEFKGFLIVVSDIEKSRSYYENLFGIKLICDNDGNMIFENGLVLQEEKYWNEFTGKCSVKKSNSCEIYFEEKDIKAFAEKLDALYPETEYVNKLTTHSWGQTVIRFYDPDGNLIEVGTPMQTAK